jgi:hypothetical protein
VLPANVSFDSRSLMPLLTNDTKSIQDWVFTEQFPAPPFAADQNGRAIRDSSLKLIRLVNGTQLVYDLSEDPAEKTNLFAHLSTEQSARVAALSNVLSELQNVPRITASTQSSNRMAVSVDYIQGAPFSLRRVDALGTNSWKTIPAQQGRTNYTVTLTDLGATNPANYYRVSTPAR